MTINLTAPICKCREKALSWSVRVNNNKMTGIVFKCKTCGVALAIPNTEVKARFALDKPYPGKPVVPQVVDDDDKEWN